MGFDDEAQFTRVVRNVHGLRHGTETLAVEVIATAAAAVTSPTSTDTQAKEAVETKADIKADNKAETVGEKKTSPILFGQRREYPTDLKIDGLGW